MSTPTKLAAHDLATLKIEEPLRAAGKAGRRLGLFAAGLGAVVGIGSLVVALRSQQPQVEGAAARPAGDPRASALLNASGYVKPRRRSTIPAQITGRGTPAFAEGGKQV